MVDRVMSGQEGGEAPAGLARRYALNVLSGFGGLVLTGALAFVFTPYVIRLLGDERYGLWALGFSLVQFTIILDLGILSTVRRFQSKAIAQERADETNEILGASLRLYLPIGLVAFGLMAGAAFALPLFADVPPMLSSEFRWLMIALGLHLFMTFARAAFGGILFAANRLDLEVLLPVLQRVLLVVVGFGLLETWRGDLLSLSVAMVLGTIVSVWVAIRLSRRLVPGLEISLRRGSQLIRPMFNFSRGVMMMTLGGAMVLYLPRLVVASFLDATAVAFISVPLMILSYVANAMQSIASPVFPVASRIDLQQGSHGLQDLYLRATRITFMIGLSMAVPLAVFGRELIGTWIGPSYGWTGELLMILVAGQVFRFAAIPGRHLLVATRGILGMGMGELAQGILAIGAMVVLVAYVETSLYTVASVLALSYGLFSGVFVPVYASRQLGLGVVGAWRAAHGRGVVLGAATVGMCLVVRELTAPSSLLATVAVVAGTAVLAFAGGWIAVLDRADRRALWAVITSIRHRAVPDRVGV